MLRRKPVDFLAILRRLSESKIFLSFANGHNSCSKLMSIPADDRIKDATEQKRHHN